MEYKIITDSCCDLTPELKELWGVTTVPFTMSLGGKDFTDDETLDLRTFMEDMNSCTGKIGSASPSPFLYKEAFEDAHTSFAVTLSSKLSGSYGSAAVGKDLAQEATGADVYIFDSLSASAGEVLVTQKIYRMVCDGIEKSEIITSVEKFIREMKTYFVLENINNLLKNGRLGKVKGKIISALGIKPIMGADGEGNIELFSQARGLKQSIERLADTIEGSGKNTEGESMVITHCGNPSFAEALAEVIHGRYRFKDILILPTGGLSSVYTDDKGVVMAF
jgi:DegV family protein with EDD domain